MFITKKHISRRTVLRGMGVTVALPLLDAMVPARDGVRQDRGRRVGVEGAAGRHRDGARLRRQHRVRPAEEPVVAGGRSGRDFDLSPSALSAARAVPRLPDDRQQHRRAQRRGVHAAGNRRRPLPLERGVPDAVASEADRGLRRATPARRSISSTRRSSARTRRSRRCSCRIENVDQAGGCAYGYTCVYTDTISWASPTQPLPMIRDPRVVFDQLFGVGATPTERAAQPARPTRASSTGSPAQVSQLQQATSAPSDRARLNEYLDEHPRDRAPHPAVEARNASGEPRELPEAPIGVPDSFEEHVKLMFDLQALAFASDIDARLLVQDGPRRRRAASIPESGVTHRLPPRLAPRRARRPRSSTSRRSTATTSAWCRTSWRS